MQSISQPSELATLPVSSALKAFLRHHLIDQPFGTLTNAEQFWQNERTGTSITLAISAILSTLL